MLDYSMLRCPTQDYITNAVKEHTNSGNDASWRSKYGGWFSAVTSAGIYGYNPYFSAQGKIQGYRANDWRKATSIVQPATLPLVGDLAAETTYPGAIGATPSGRLWRVQWPHPIAIKYGWPARRRNWDVWGPAANHNGSINYLFADAHVESKKGMWPWDRNDPTRPGNKYFHPKRNLKEHP